MNADDTKRCAKCWRYLPLTDFGHDGRTRDNLTYRCNDCRTIVPIDDTNSSERAETSVNQNDRAETHTSTIDHHGDI
jgi:DNA-directed RNA polymerase subunit RPC12/RpoP